jgi:hypothetical protein
MQKTLRTAVSRKAQNDASFARLAQVSKIPVRDSDLAAYIDEQKGNVGK